jgi:hypothetical protein
MITNQLLRQTKFEAAGYPSQRDQLVQLAARDARVGDMAVRFFDGDFRLDDDLVSDIATEYGISANDVTENACLQSLISRFYEGPDGEA